MSGKNTSTTYSSQKSGPEERMRTEGWGLLDQAKSLAAQNPEYKKYDGEAVADYDPSDFAKVKDSISGLMAGNGDYDTTRSILDQLRGTVDTSKTTQDYMSPYTAGVLDPTLRNLREQGQLARNGINAQATGAGAFGDTGHAFLEAEQRKNEAQGVGDATAAGYDRAWNSAQAARNADLARLLGIGTAGQSLGAAEAGQKATSANMLDQLMGQDRSIRQAKDAFNYSEFDAAKQHPYQQLGWLQQFLNATPHQTISSGEQTQVTPNNALQGILGSLAGGLFGKGGMFGAGGEGAAGLASMGSTAMSALAAL